MFAEDEPLFPPRPFSFVSTDVLTNVLRTEINAVTRLLAKYPKVRDLFDAPEATVPQRRACFYLLAHRNLTEMICETLSASYDESPSLGEVESEALRRTDNLVIDDAPAWVLEMNQVVERLPSYILHALPEPLRAAAATRVDPNNAAQLEAVQSAATALNNVEEVQALINQVLDEQLKRLQQRWRAAQREPQNPKHWLKGTEGLTPKADLSRYKRGLTEKQELAFSLKWEYGLGLTEIASRMGLDRKTAYEHIEAAKRKMNEAVSGEKGNANRAESPSDF